jgi:hypothetical protein
MVGLFLKKRNEYLAEVFIARNYIEKMVKIPLQINPTLRVLFVYVRVEYAYINLE